MEFAEREVRSTGMAAREDLLPAALPAFLGARAEGEVASIAGEGGVETVAGSLWTARQRQGHSLHEISYRACFKPQLPEFFLNMLTAPGDVVLDPFLGRGTTAVQAALMGRVAVGSDVNPLSAFLTRPRLAPPSVAHVAQRLREIPDSAPVSAEEEELTVFFHPRTLAKLVAMKNWFAARDADGRLDEVDAWIRMVALNRLTGHSPGFFSVKTMPPNVAVSVRAQRAINEKHGRLPGVKDVDAIILKKTRCLLRSGGMPAVGGAGRHNIVCADARRLDYLSDGAVDAVVTSPPFLDVVDYGQDNWLRCWFAGIAVEALAIARYRDVGGWEGFVRAVFGELARVVKQGGWVAFEVGEARGGRVLLEEAVCRAVAGMPFAVAAVVVNSQRFTKTANCWGVGNNAKGTNSNRVVVLVRT